MILEIRTYGDPVLRQKGRRIERVTDDIRQLADDMVETMVEAGGVGLAAQQIGRAIQLTVIDTRPSDRPWIFTAMDGQVIDPDKAMPLVLLNPTLHNPRGEEKGVEGCLSVPEISADIVRAEVVEVHADSLQGGPIVFQCSGLLARCVQHEVDHLQGILFIDRMDAATRAALSGQLKRLQKETRDALALQRGKR